MIPIHTLPALNAIFNTSCALCLIIGAICIYQKQPRAHAACMGLAFLMSTLFLVSYLTYHAHAGSTPFPGHGWIRPVYFTLLISHTILATAIVPLALRTFYLAIRGHWEQHVRLARWTFPIWLYVSVTGVAIYWMLYRMHWTGIA